MGAVPGVPAEQEAAPDHAADGRKAASGLLPVMRIGNHPGYRRPERQTPEPMTTRVNVRCWFRRFCFGRGGDSPWEANR